MMQWDVESEQLIGKSMFIKVVLMSVSTHSALVSKADCYVELKLPTASPFISRTQVVDNSDNPEWNETFRYRIHSAVKVRSAFCGGGWATCICVLAYFWYFIQNHGVFITLKYCAAWKVPVFFSGTKSCAMYVQFVSPILCELQVGFPKKVLLMQPRKGKLWHYLVEFKEIPWQSNFLFKDCFYFDRVAICFLVAPLILTAKGLSEDNGEMNF